MGQLTSFQCPAGPEWPVEPEQRVGSDVRWPHRVFADHGSRKRGRPTIPNDHIALIRRISADHPEWGEDKIAEELAAKLGVRHSTSTIRKYMVRRREPRGGQTWKTFIKNHAGQIFAVPTPLASRPVHFFL